MEPSELNISSEAKMDLGLAIFLSATLLSAVAMYGLTKDRISWSRLLKWAFGSVAFGVAAIAIGFCVYDYLMSAGHIKTIAGINLGDTEASLLLKKGKPKLICSGGDLKRLGYFTEKGIFDLTSFDYYIKNGSVHAIEMHRLIFSKEMPDPYAAEWDQFGVSRFQGTEAKRIAQKWGTPDEIVSQDHSTVYLYRKLNTAYTFHEDQKTKKDEVNGVRIVADGGQLVPEAVKWDETCRHTDN